MKIFVTFQSILWIYFVQISVCAVIKGEDKSKDCGPNQRGKKQSFLWTIKQDPPSYLFGTIHVPYTRVYDYIPDNVKQAFRQSDNVFFELDLTDPSTMTSLANCQLLPHGENLANILPADLYMRLKKHLEYVREKMSNWVTDDQKGKGLYGEYFFDVIAGNWERKRPIWVMLLVNSLTESDIKSRENPVLDLFLAQEAERLNKITGAVEKVEEQCVPLNDLNYSQVLFALNRTLRQHESYRLENSAIPFSTDDLIDHYNCGDLNDIIFKKDSSQLQSLLNSSLPPEELKTAKRIDNYFRTELINKRNQRMADRVADLLERNPEDSFFFAFGAGHFLGNNTVINLLQEKGFHIEHTHPYAEIPRQRVHRRHKNRQRNWIQEQFGDVWEEMDQDSRLWIEANRAEQRKKYKNNQPFNELWIRMETPNADTTSKNPSYLVGSSSSVLVPQCSFVSSLTLVCLVWTFIVHYINR